MKKALLLIITLCLFACVNSKYGNLTEKTDYFVNELSTTYSSYGLQGLSDKKYTEDRKYSAVPIGRLVIVRIEDSSATKEDYEALRTYMEKHYKNNSSVNKVYINQGGTVVVDCRK